MKICVKIIYSLVLFIRAFLTFTRPLPDKLLDVIFYIFYFNSKPLPLIGNRILLMSATQLAREIRKKEITAVEVMQIYISRIKAVQPIINACVDNRFEEAMADARAVDRMLEAGIKTENEIAEEMPLLGVPFTCKEIIGVKGLRSTWGLKRDKDHKAKEDSDAAARYRLAGAIPVVVTNIPTMCLWWDSSNPASGSTKNPFDYKRTPGGSSGGEGALIASAGAVIGIGNDLAGSIRIPSSFCGIYGHKPSEGIISNIERCPKMSNTQDSIENLNPFTSTGPMCRYAEDLQLLVKVLSGNDKKLRLNEQVNFRNVKVYYMEELPGFLLSATSEIKASVRKAVKHFEQEYGITATKLNMKELKHAFYIWQCKVFEAAGAFLSSAIADENGELNIFREFVKWLFGFSEYDCRILYFALIELKKKDKSFYDGLSMYNKIEKKFHEILDDNSIFILPTLPEPPPHPILTIPKFESLAYTCLGNILGLPGTSVPASMSNGLPIGLQILAKKNNDHLTIASAVELDKVFGGWHNPCPVLL